VPAKKPKQASSLSAFISHAKGDAKKAQEIAASLEERGLKCWIAPRDVRAGRSYGDEIITGIENSRSFVLVLSRASNDSAFVAREVERAVSKKKPIFAIRVANVEPSPSLELFHLRHPMDRCLFGEAWPPYRSLGKLARRGRGGRAGQACDRQRGH
jgi:hypothetical protein